MNSNILRSRTLSCLEVVKYTLEAVLEERKPADRTISSYFKGNRKYGSSDRKLLYEVVFSLFRWLGWAMLLISPSKSNPKELFNNISNKSLLIAILAATLLDNLKEKEIISYWMDELNIDFSLSKEFEKAHTIKERANVFQKFLLFLSIKKEVLLRQLLPDLSYSKVPPDIDIEKFIEYCQTRPPIWLRLQTKDSSSFIAELKESDTIYAFHKYMKNSIRINQSEKSLYNYKAFSRGIFEIQDIASQVIGFAASPKAGQRWWDCCAGGGGKTLQLAYLMENRGRIIASDIREYKLEDLKKRARRAGFFNIECRPWDGLLLRKKKSESFDGVLIDSPCTCSGTWRRNPDAKWHFSEKELSDINEIQKKLIRSAASAVKSGGVLIYATCSFIEEENLSIVNSFLSESKEFKMEPFINPLNGKETPGFLQIYPWHADCDAMFVARLKKHEDTV